MFLKQGPSRPSRMYQMARLLIINTNPSLLLTFGIRSRSSLLSLPPQILSFLVKIQPL
ncbi:hypothetical protein NC651_011584 [Populus alba x Populus x berolinensis]|nr:hypothetical protein NC651_011584 [Populus alba x Populus x berolinensis]